MIILFFIQTIFGWRTECRREMRRHILAGWRREGGGVQTEQGMLGGEEGRGRGEIRSTFRLDKSLQIRRDRKKRKGVQRSFCSTSCSSFRHINTLMLQRIQNPPDCSTLTVWHLANTHCGVLLQQSYQGANAGKMNAGWRFYSWGIAYIPFYAKRQFNSFFCHHTTSEICSIHPTYCNHYFSLEPHALHVLNVPWWNAFLL